MNDERETGADVAPAAPYIHHLLLLSKLARTGTGSEGAVKHADHAGVFCWCSAHDGTQSAAQRGVMTEGVWSLDGCMCGLLAGAGHEGDCGWEGARGGGVVVTAWMKAGMYAPSPRWGGRGKGGVEGGWPQGGGGGLS
jgi:hypothetical protein